MGCRSNSKDQAQHYTIFMVTALGSFFALVSPGLPQWKAEKWSAARVTSSKDKQVLLTRGNGHQYAMLVNCKKGAWDVETMATSRPVYCQGTRWCLWPLAALWITLFFTTLGIKHDTWPDELGLVLTPDGQCPTIAGFQRTTESKKANLKQAFDKAKDTHPIGEPATEARDVMGAIMELEKRMSDAGKGLLPIFFPGGEDTLTDFEKKLWAVC